MTYIEQHYIHVNLIKLARLLHWRMVLYITYITYKHKTRFVEPRGVCLGTRYVMSRHVYAAVKKCVLSLLRVRMSIGSEFQTFGAATLNARFAVSVCVLGTNSRRASVDRSDRIVSWHCSSSLRYGGTDVNKALCVMRATLYQIRCCISSQCKKCNVKTFVPVRSTNTLWSWIELN